MLEEMVGRKLNVVDPLLFRMTGVSKVRQELKKRNTRNTFFKESSFS